jgi:curved DNA-binding protein CbpA
MRLSHRLPQLRLRRSAFITSGKDPRKKPARTLYELLGIRPDADSKKLHLAFRDAAKVHHPDLNPGDPDATRRFTQIVNAYGILRNAEQRVVYDEMLAFERERRRARLTRTVFDAVAVVGLAVVIVGGFALFEQFSKTSVETARVTEAATRKPADMVIAPGAIVPDEGSHAPLMTAKGEPAGRTSEVAEAVDALVAAIDRGDMGSRADGQSKPDENSHAASAIANGDPASDPSGPDSEVARAIDTLVAAVDRGDMGKSRLAKAVDALIAAIDRGDMSSGAADKTKNAEPHSLDQTGPGSVEPRSSPPDRAKSPSPEVAILDAKHDAGMNAGPRMHPKRPATDRATVGRAGTESRDLSQVALASRNVTPCGGSCANQAPPLFGVGF